jgi:hypothetical protein
LARPFSRILVIDVLAKNGYRESQGHGFGESIMDLVMIERNTTGIRFNQADEAGLCPECEAAMNEVDRLGKTMEPGTFWSGLIDDVRIYSRALWP